MSPTDWPVHAVALIAGNAATTRWPDFPEAATLAHGRLGHGAGPDRESALRRAAGEMIEIASCCSWGDEQLVWASVREVAGAGWAPPELLGFSEQQTRNRESWNARLEDLDWIPPTGDDSRQIAWLRASCAFSGDTILVPADIALIGRRERGDEEAAAIADTNGCAAGQTAAQAKLAALYELVERDATGRWWYGQRARRELAPPADEFMEAILRCLSRRRRRFKLIDITSDIALPTVAAVACADDGTDPCVGFATRQDYPSAIRSALTELMLMELRRLADVSAGGHLEFPRTLAAETLSEAKAAPPGESATDLLDESLEKLFSAGCRLAWLDFTRPAIDVPVFRAISPDLCHWKPRLGRPRLLAPDPRDMGRAVSRKPNPVLLTI